MFINSYKSSKTTPSSQSFSDKSKRLWSRNVARKLNTSDIYKDFDKGKRYALTLS